MQILYITGGFPFPLTSGFLRHYHLIRELSAHHAITLLSLAGPQYKSEHGDAMRPFLKELHVFPAGSRGSSLVRRWRQGRRMLTGREVTLDQMRSKVRELLDRSPFDVVIQSSKTTTPVLDELRETPVLVDLCDAASERVRGRIRHSNWQKTPWLWMEYLVTRSAERRYLQRATHMTFASCRDREALVPDQVERASVIPNGVDIEYWHRTTSARPNHRIVFTGAMHYAPNVDASVFLATQIMPRVLKESPQTRLFLVGRDPRPEVQALAQLPNVTVTGYVDDVRPYLEEATLFVAPLRFGTGIQNKVLEAMAMEIPVIASPVAADGLRTEAGHLPPIETAATADEFAQAILRGFQIQTTHPHPDRQVREFVREHFHWATSAERVNDLLHRITPTGASQPLHRDMPRLQTLASLAANGLPSQPELAVCTATCERVLEKKVN